jgi:hypothetical protein
MTEHIQEAIGQIVIAETQLPQVLHTLHEYQRMLGEQCIRDLQASYVVVFLEIDDQDIEDHPVEIGENRIYQGEFMDILTRVEDIVETDTGVFFKCQIVLIASVIDNISQQRFIAHGGVNLKKQDKMFFFQFYKK